MNFRRYYIPGSAIFLTQVVASRRPVFQDQKFIELLKTTLKNVKDLHPFNMLGYVFLPDHFHLLLQPGENENFSTIMHSLKPNFTKEYKKLVGISSTDSLKFWQKRFWDHVIRDDKDFETHIHYINFNPVKHGYVTDARNWPNSSYLEWEKRGLYPPFFEWEEPDNTDWGE
jgi:putative transposase